MNKIAVFVHAGPEYPPQMNKIAVFVHVLLNLKKVVFLINRMKNK